MKGRWVLTGIAMPAVLAASACGSPARSHSQPRSGPGSGSGSTPSTSSNPVAGSSAGQGSGSSQSSNGNSGGGVSASPGNLTLSGAVSDSVRLASSDVSGCRAGGAISIVFMTSKGIYQLTIDPSIARPPGVTELASEVGHLGAVSLLLNTTSSGSDDWRSDRAGTSGTLSLGPAASGPSGSIAATLGPGGALPFAGPAETVRGSWTCPS